MSVHVMLRCLAVRMQVSVSLLQLFDQWQQGALQQIKNTIDTLTKATGQRAKVTAPPPESSDDEGDDETQVCLRRAQRAKF